MEPKRAGTRLSAGAVGAKHAQRACPAAESGKSRTSVLHFSEDLQRFLDGLLPFVKLTPTLSLLVAYLPRLKRGKECALIPLSFPFSAEVKRANKRKDRSGNVQKQGFARVHF